MSFSTFLATLVGSERRPGSTLPDQQLVARNLATVVAMGGPAHPDALVLARALRDMGARLELLWGDETTQTELRVAGVTVWRCPPQRSADLPWALVAALRGSDPVAA